MFFRLKRNRGIDYLQLVSNERIGRQVQQRVLASLGRLEDLRAGGMLDRLADTIGNLGARGLTLIPPFESARVEIVADPRVLESLANLLAGDPVVEDVLTHFCAAAPSDLRRLTGAVAFEGLTEASQDEDNLAWMQRLGEPRSLELGEASVMALRRVLAGERGRQAELVLGARVAAAGAPPSIMRGLVTCLATELDGTPIAAGHWPAHLPPLKPLLDMATHLVERVGAARVTLCLDRSFATDSMLSVLAKTGIGFVVPVRRSQTPLSGDGSNLSAHEIRAPQRAGGGPGAPPPDLRYIQVVDPVAAAVDWRLRRTQLERVERSLAALEGPAGPAQARLGAMRSELIEGERWDGATILATNLAVSPHEVTRRFLLESEVRQWDRELTRFGERLLEVDASNAEAAAMLSGGAAVALVGAYLRHAVLDRLGKALGRTRTWAEVEAALHSHRAVRIRQGDREVVLAPERPQALVDLLDALAAHGGGTNPVVREVGASVAE